MTNRQNCRVGRSYPKLPDFNDADFVLRGVLERANLIQVTLGKNKEGEEIKKYCETRWPSKYILQ